ncbi:MAG: DUF4332 domain-containing protein [Cyanobacteriota bacterium]|nr:DUF4332 domain-containing protein [Cyanobacteriota bacterium]
MSRPDPQGLEQLPAHFHRERTTLLAAGFTTWDQVASLPKEQLRVLASTGVASEARLLRIHAQARLMATALLAPEEASLLLHAGIADARALAESDPQRLQVQVSRLWQRLLGPSSPPPSLSTVRRWIQAAASGRSAN